MPIIPYLAFIELCNMFTARFISLLKYWVEAGLSGEIGHLESRLFLVKYFTIYTMDIKNNSIFEGGQNDQMGLFIQ